MPADPPVRPATATTGLLLLYVSLGVAVLSLVWQIPHFSRLSGGMPGLALGVTLVVYAFIALLIVMIGQGRGWALIVYTILFIFGLAMTIMGMAQGKAPASQMALGLLQLAIQLTAVVLLFLPASAAWFSAKKQARRKKPPVS